MDKDNELVIDREFEGDAHLTPEYRQARYEAIEEAKRKFIEKGGLPFMVDSIEELEKIDRSGGKVNDI